MLSSKRLKQQTHISFIRIYARFVKDFQLEPVNEKTSFYPNLN